MDKSGCTLPFMMQEVYYYVAIIVWFSLTIEKVSSIFEIVCARSIEDSPCEYFFVTKNTFRSIPDDYTKLFMIKSLRISDTINTTHEFLKNHGLTEGNEFNVYNIHL